MSYPYDSEPINRDVLWRVFSTLDGLLYSYIAHLERNAFNYRELDDDRLKISTTIQLLNGPEQTFMDWATKTMSKDGYYEYEHYGIASGCGVPQCYANVYSLLHLAAVNETVFDYWLSEYTAMEATKISMARIQDREYRTCDKCGTRFDSIDGMHRHRPRCNGQYRGDYHGRTGKHPDWNDGPTTAW